MNKLCQWPRVPFCRMSSKIFRAAFHVVLSTFLIIPFLLFGVDSTHALVKGWNPPVDESLSSEAKGDNPLGIVIEPSGDNLIKQNEQKLYKSDSTNYPDLGSEQVFPFEPGLGNSAF